MLRNVTLTAMFFKIFSVFAILLCNFMFLNSSTITSKIDTSLNETSTKVQHQKNVKSVLLSDEKISQQQPKSFSNKGNSTLRIVAILKLLQFLNKLTGDIEKNGTNSLSSESRSLVSWLQTQKSQRRFNNPKHANFNILPSPPLNMPRPPPPLSHSSSPKFYKVYDKFIEPNPLLLLPPLADTTVIDYWLKYLENSKIDDHIPSLKNILNKKPNIVPKHWTSNEMKKVELFRNKIGLQTDDYHRKHNPNENHNGSHQKELAKDISLEYSEEEPNSDFKKTAHSKKNFKQSFEHETTPRCDKFTENICIDDFEYPEHALLDEIKKRKEIFQLMYSEVNNDVPLVDGIPKDMDENFSQDYYYGNTEQNSDSNDYDSYSNQDDKNIDKLTNDDSKHSKSNNKNLKKDGGFVCLSEVLYAKPKLARSIKGKWRVIVNAGDFTQTIRMEKCTKPNSECRFIADQKYSSRCAQINSIHRLLVFEKGKGFYIDTFRVPTACTCHVYSVKQPINDRQSNFTNGYFDESLVNIDRVKHIDNNNKPTSNLEQTLLSIFQNKKVNQNNNKNPSNKNDQNHEKKFFFITNRQKTETPNNENFFKLLPRLNSVEHDNALQRLVEEITGERFPGNFDHHFSNNNNNNRLFTINKSRLIKHLISPHSNVGFIDDLDIHSHSDQAIDNNHQKPLDQSAGVTIISSPNKDDNDNSDSVRQSPPIVQVIHVPVSTGTQIDHADDQIKRIIRPFQNSDFYELTNYSKYLTSASNTYPSTSNNFTMNHTESMLFNESNTKIQDSTANTTFETPTISNDNEEDDYFQDDAENQDQSEIQKTNNNTKMNFSYHPILEYIIK